MSKQSFTKEELINKRARVRRFIQEIQLIAPDLGDDKDCVAAASQFIAALTALVNFYNMKLGEMIRD